MTKYYFAESCLQVSDDSDFLCEIMLSNFKNVTSYFDEFMLETSFDKCPLFENAVNVLLSSGIIVHDIGENKWLFSTTDKNNLCYIETTSNCSILKCYINLSECADINILKENFIHLLRTISECHLAHCGGVSLHSSCISFNGKAILFTAPSGTGKSTQADIWKNYLGAKIINGDRPLLHIFPDEVRAYGVPWDGKEQIFLQENYTVSAIVEVRQAKKNVIRKLNEKQAFKLMIKQCFIPMWDDKAKFAVMETISRIVKKVSFYRLFCLPDEKAATLLHSVLFENKYNILKEERPDMKIKEGFILKNIIDEWIVMPAGSNIKKFEGAIILNGVSAFIWKQLEKSICYDDLLRSVLDEYNIDEQTAAADMNNFVNKLRNLEILQEE